MLHKKQTNDLFTLIANKHLNAEDFALVQEQSTKGNISIVTHKPTEYYFKMRVGVASRSPGGEFPILHLSYTPDTTSIVFNPKTEKPLPFAEKWPPVVEMFEKWLAVLEEENAAPDLWAEAAATAQLFAAPAAPDEKFTDHELRELQSQLRAAEAKLATSGLPEAAVRELTAALRDAAPKAETMTKKDWQNMVVGAVVSTLTGLALSADHVQTVYQILKATFTGWLLH